MVMDTRHVILNMFQNLSAEKWKDNARGEKLKFAVERAHSPLCSRLGKAFLTLGNAFPPRETVF